MIRQIIAVAALAAGFARGAQAEDAVLARLLEEAVAASPEVAQARAAVLGESAHVPQAGAFPDPTLTLGIQNDGFDRIKVGEAETSFYNVMITQPVPWPGKRGLRESIATLEQRRAQARLQRTLLDLEGRVRRAYLALVLVDARLELLQEQERLWMQAEHAARARYEAGQTPQSDLLRAQLERARLQQQRWALEADSIGAVAELNRDRARPLDEPIRGRAKLAQTPDPQVASHAEAQRDAEERSPELQLSLLGAEQSARRVDLARRERWPDLAVTAAVMPRGSLEPMWQLGVSVGLPIFSRRGSAVEESEQRRAGAEQGAAAVRQVLQLRTHHRLLTLAALNRTNQQYRSQILVLSAAAVRSTLGQYEVGRVPFAAVLEALSGYVGDRTSYLASVGEAQLVAIAQRELSLEAGPSMGGGGGSGPLPGAAGVSAGTSSQPAQAENPGAGANSPARSMSGM